MGSNCSIHLSPSLLLGSPLHLHSAPFLRPSIHPVKPSETVKTHCQHFDWLESSEGQKCCQAESERINLYAEFAVCHMYCYDSRKLHSLLCLRFGKVFIVSTQDLNSGYLFLSSFLNLRKIFIEILNSSIRLHLFFSWSIRSMDFVGSPGSICPWDQDVRMITFLRFSLRTPKRGASRGQLSFQPFFSES